MAKTPLQFRHNGREVAIFVDGGSNLLDGCCATKSAIIRPNSAAARAAAAPARC